MVGPYTHLLVSNSVSKEDNEVKTLRGDFKDHVDNLSATSSSTTKNISKLETRVAATKKVVDQAAIKVIALKK